jgi:hypothetical protein
MSDKHLERKEVLNLVYTRQAERMADAYARLMADFLQMTAWGRGIESDLSWARAELMQVKAELERVRLIAHDNKQALYNAKAEVERLTAENTSVKLGNAELRQMVIERGKTAVEDIMVICRLEAEVERLTNGIRAIDPLLLEAINSATLAKKGGQP